eukprot:5107855-Pyramimonas_sp.AAC.1
MNLPSFFYGRRYCRALAQCARPLALCNRWPSKRTGRGRWTTASGGRGAPSTATGGRTSTAEYTPRRPGASQT